MGLQKLTYVLNLHILQTMNNLMYRVPAAVTAKAAFLIYFPTKNTTDTLAPGKYQLSP